MTIWPGDHIWTDHWSHSRKVDIILNQFNSQTAQFSENCYIIKIYLSILSLSDQVYSARWPSTAQWVLSREQRIRWECLLLDRCTMISHLNKLSHRLERHRLFHGHSCGKCVFLIFTHVTNEFHLSGMFVLLLQFDWNSIQTVQGPRDKLSVGFLWSSLL